MAPPSPPAIAAIACVLAYWLIRVSPALWPVAFLVPVGGLVLAITTIRRGEGIWGARALGLFAIGPRIMIVGILPYALAGLLFGMGG